MSDTVYTNRFGQVVPVKKIPMSTGKRKFSGKATAEDNKISVFERFKDSNGGRHKSL